MKSAIAMMSSFLLFSKNLMSILISTIVTCIFASVMMFLLSLNSWLSVLLVLIYISGIMVMFMFIISLSPNEKNTYKNKKASIALALTCSTVSVSHLLEQSEKLKLNTSYKANMWAIALMVLMISLSAYIPPQMGLTAYSGVKSSK